MSETWCKKCKAQTDWIQWHDDKYEREVYCCEWCGRKEYIYDDDEGTMVHVVEGPDLPKRLRCGERVADKRTRMELREAADEIEMLTKKVLDVADERDAARKAARGLYQGLDTHRRITVKELYPWLEEDK